MRLINTATLQIESFPRFDRPQIPPYVILSHRWGAEEVSLQEMQTPTPSLTSKLGYLKVVKSSAVAASFGFEYVWIDTCCIDKTNNAELTEAINSMFKYYRDADVCYAYLADVPSGEDPGAEGSRFRGSSWFTRGWTLQELIAPEILVFYGSDWREIGTKSSLENVVVGITYIPPQALKSYERNQRYFSIAQKMAWASYRETERLEDMAYCLMGLLGVNMPLIYGEGQNAFRRLQLELLKESNDQSIFAWTVQHPEEADSTRGLLAYCPAEFRNSHNIVRSKEFNTRPQSETSMTNIGLKITLPFLRSEDHKVPEGAASSLRSGREIFIAILGCQRKGDVLSANPNLNSNGDGAYGIFLESNDGVFGRIHPNWMKLLDVKVVEETAVDRTVYITQIFDRPHRLFRSAVPYSDCIHVFHRRVHPLNIHSSDPGNDNLIPWTLGNDEFKLKLGTERHRYEGYIALLFKYGKPRSHCAVFVHVFGRTFCYSIQADMGLEDLNQLKAGRFEKGNLNELGKFDRRSIALKGGQTLYFAARQGYIDGNNAHFIEVSVDGDFHLDQIVKQYKRMR
ncbi:hypothetical protein IFR05_012538 [Cadophora sp. M221]|nr:hypothetical protein IFR05_012538 [Cadophora sp. M221]